MFDLMSFIAFDETFGEFVELQILKSTSFSAALLDINKSLLFLHLFEVVGIFLTSFILVLIQQTSWISCLCGI